MVDELVNVLELPVEIVGGYPIGARRGYVHTGVPQAVSEGGYAVAWHEYTSGTADVQLQAWGSPDGDRRPVVTSVMFDSPAEAKAEFERLKALLLRRKWVERATTKLVEAGIVPEEFRDLLLAGEEQAFLVAADWQDDRDNPDAALLLRSAYHQLRGEVNVTVPAGKGRVIVLNPREVSKRFPVQPGLGDPRAAVVDVGAGVRIVSMRTEHESVRGDDGKYATVVTTFIDAREFKVGDQAMYDSYNLAYFAPITAVTAKTVVIAEGHRAKTTRFTIAKFVGWNAHFDLAKAQERNANWSD